MPSRHAKRYYRFIIIIIIYHVVLLYGVVVSVLLHGFYPLFVPLSILIGRGGHTDAVYTRTHTRARTSYTIRVC